jgi:hypothetical protein
MNRINVNADNSKVIDGRLFITGIKMNRLTEKFKQFIIPGNTIVHPSLGLMYEYDGPYSRA